MNATIRPATSADGPALRALIYSVLDEYGLPQDPLGTDADLSDIASNYRGGRFWVVEADGALVGSCALYPLGDGVVELRKMYLAPALRGLGWGRRLLEQAIETARADGHVRIRLETTAVLKEAIRLYERFGFQRLPGVPGASRCDQLWALEL